MASDRTDSERGGARVVEAEYIPASVRPAGDRPPRPARRGTPLWAYLLVAPVVGGIAAGAIAINRQWSSGGIGHIEVNANPPDARVWLDGKQVAERSPASLTVHTGVHDLVIARDGFNPIEQRVDVKADEIVAVSVALVVAAPPAHAAPAPVHHHRPKLPAKLDGVVYVDMGKHAPAEPAAADPPATGGR